MLMSWMKLLEPLLPFLIIEFERPDKVWFMKTLTNRIISVRHLNPVSALTCSWRGYAADLGSGHS